MKLKGMTDEDFLQYKKPSLLLVFPTCTFKCCIECGSQVCQNWSLAMAPMMEVSSDTIIQRYLSNPITQAIVCGGLEPFDSFDELFQFIELSEYFQDLDWTKNEKRTDLFFRLIEKQYNKYLQERKDKQEKIGEMYGDTIEFSKYKLIPVSRDIEILVLDPPRIYDSAKNKTIILEERKEIIEVINKLFIV